MTQFELLTAAAFSELAERGVEAAVVEAGLGGRHDATNVLAAPVAVLTNVGLEHTRWLGPTITDIAREKLAVVAPGSTLVVGELDPEAEAEVAKVDARVVHADPADGAPFTGFQRTNFAGRRERPAAPRAPPASWPRLDDGRGPPRRVLAHRARPLPGRRRRAADDLRRRAQPARGRGARRRAADAVGDKPLVAVLSVLDDKDAAGMLRELVAARRRRGLHRRAQPARAVARPRSPRCGSQLGGPAAEIEADPRAAVERARELAGEDGAVVATGSIYLVADLLAEPGRRRASAL